MKTTLAFLYICLILILASCSKEFASPKDSNIGVFDELLQFVEENYALFEVKQIDWEAVKTRYRPKISNLVAQDSFFSICQSTVAELKDGQSSVSRYTYPKPYDFTVGYDIQFKQDVALGYLKWKGSYGFGSWAGSINDTTAYAHFSSLYYTDSSDKADAMYYLSFSRYKKVIIDLRNTYGGQPLGAFELLRYFVSNPTNVGVIVNKDGKGRQDFKKVPIVVQPASPYLGDTKIIILTNRYTCHVAAYVVAVLQDLPNVTIVGQTTGPGSGIGLPYELPNGWVVTVSSNYFLPANGRHIEDGIKPDIEINNTALDLQNKRDRMLERAIAY
jgi:C-terminal processing protease CtpA/Prc